MGYDLSICLLKPILNPLQKKKKKRTIDFSPFSYYLKYLLKKKSSSSWPDLILLFFSGTEIESLVNKLYLSGGELLYNQSIRHLENSGMSFI